MNIKDINIISLKSIKDTRGYLTSIEEIRDIPIEIKRVFYMTEISASRGGHAHIDTDQILICIHGSFKLKVFDGNNFFTKNMNSQHEGIYIPRKLFVEMYDFSKHAVCLVLANTFYNINKSIRSLKDYKRFVNK